MDDGGKLVGGQLRVGEKKAFGNLRKCIPKGFGFVSKRYGEVGFKLGDQVRNNRALKSCKVGEGEELADILYAISRLSKKSCREPYTLFLP